MTGLFDRLAARAVGTEVIAEPRLTAIFEPVAAGDFFGEVDGVSDAETAPSRSPQHLLPPRQAPAQLRTEASETSVAPPHDNSVPDAPRGHRVETPTPTSPEASQRTAGQPLRPDPRSNESTETTIIERLTHTEVAAHVVETDAPFPAPADVSAPPAPTREAPTTSDVSVGWPVDAKPPIDAAMAPPAPADTPRSQPTPISVTIGRIEVRAPSRPAAPPRVRTRAPAPRIRLTTYLKERR